MTSAGVIITPKSAKRRKSVTFSSSYSMPESSAACFTAAVSWLHFAQPVPRICSFFIMVVWFE